MNDKKGSHIKFKTKLMGAIVLGTALATTAFHRVFSADDTIKFGFLHSLSGTIAISETTRKDMVLFL